MILSSDDQEIQLRCDVFFNASIKARKKVIFTICDDLEGIPKHCNYLLHINLTIYRGIKDIIAITIVFDSVRTIAPEENCPTIRVRVWFRVTIRVRGQFSEGNCTGIYLNCHIKYNRLD